MSTAPRRIAITGGSGFVGQWLRRRIEETGCDVALPILSRDDQDIRDTQAVSEAVRSARPDVLIHLAAIAAPLQAREAPAEAWNVNVLGTLNLATAITRDAPMRDCSSSAARKLMELRLRVPKIPLKKTRHSSRAGSTARRRPSPTSCSVSWREMG